MSTLTPITSPDGHRLLATPETLAALGDLAAHLPDVAGADILILTQNDVRIPAEHQTLSDHFSNHLMYTRGIHAFFQSEGITAPKNPDGQENGDYYLALGNGLAQNSNYSAALFAVEQNGKPLYVITAPQLPVPTDVFYQIGESDNNFVGPRTMDQKSATAFVMAHEAGHIYHTVNTPGGDELERETYADLHGIYGYNLMIERGIDLNPEGPDLAKALRDVGGLNTHAHSKVLNITPTADLHGHDTGLIVAHRGLATGGYAHHTETIDQFFRETNALIGASYKDIYATILNDPTMTTQDRQAYTADQSLLVSTHHPYDPDIKNAVSLLHQERHAPQNPDRALLTENTNVGLGKDIGLNYPEIQYAFARAMYDAGLYDDNSLSKSYAERYMAGFERLNPDLVEPGRDLAAGLSPAMAETWAAQPPSQPPHPPHDMEKPSAAVPASAPIIGVGF
ncbi:hypothetical protein [Micavibrio aeruginosavorus]|uniref:Uncharacterized protein n=1 Tax=Micavibrio aeruginosavorus EPB TaxID=349215 RepID=M4VLL3_9BACT|nr:hypothetical protein [Micavibrio aeruginosavorus]AGH98991.1 hypothetical protein A11S_2195 [Micavibrio aeruginosavorus EPB]